MVIQKLLGWILASEISYANVTCSFENNNVCTRFLHINVGELKKDRQNTGANSYSSSVVWKEINSFVSNPSILRSITVEADFHSAGGWGWGFIFWGYILLLVKWVQF